MKKVNPLFYLVAVALLASTASVGWAQENEASADNADRDAAIVEFHIPKGTGNRPWNTRAAMVKVHVGQTVRIVNDDTVVHRLHTFGRPCLHQPGESKPGDFYDCEITTPADPDIDLCYDHNFGATSRFYIKSTP